MKIAIVGTRGIPAKYGGFETFAQEVSPLLVNLGHIVTVYCDRLDSKNGLEKFGNVKLRYLTTTKSDMPLFYYFLSIYYGLKENDVILVAGTGGSFFYFLNIFFRKVLITNTDGVESRRAKWSKFKRLIIKVSEFLAVKFSTHLIADSQGIKRYILNTYPNLQSDKISVIEYGSDVNNLEDSEYISTLGLKENNYFLVVSRLEPENNVQMIVEGYNLYAGAKPLVIVGNKLDTKYCQELEKIANDNVLFLGGIYHQQKLKILRFASFAYIHGHSVGGTNPSLLEALGSSNTCICHDNEFNREVTNNEMIYFSTAKECTSCLDQLEKASEKEYFSFKKNALKRVTDYYNWNRIAIEYNNMINKVIVR